MKRSFFLALLLLIGAVPTFAQTDNRFCPKIRVIGPSGITNPGEKMTFAASVSGAMSSLRYEWTVSQGEIVEGQGTAAITVSGVSGSEAGTNVEAMVKIGPIPSGCSDSASESAPVAAILPYCSLVEWGKLKPNDERAQYDNVFTELANNPTHKAFILLTVGQRERLDSSNSRIKFAVKHAKFRKVDLGRLIFGLVLSDEQRTTIWRLPPGGKPPCEECMIIDGEFLQ